MGSTSSLINLLINVFVGLSVGANVLVARYYGGQKDKDVSETVHTAITTSIISGLFLVILGVAAARPLLELMGTPEDVLDQSVLYMRIYFAGMPVLMLYNFGSAILRAVGDTRRPLYFLIASCFTNIVLDIVFVVCLHMGVMGAALATIISQLVSAVLVIIVLMKTKESYHLIPRSIRLDLDMLKRIIQIGFPAGLQSVMYSASNVIIQSSVNALGTDTIAAWTAYGKIDSVFWMIINAFGISVTTFVGQNYGAGKKDRVHKGVRVCLAMSFAATFLLSVLLYCGGSYIYLLFTTDAAVIEKGTEILQYLVPTFFTYVCIEIYSGSLRGVGDCWIPMIITCLGVCALRVVWIWAAVPLRPTIQTVIFSYPLTWVITSILFFFYFNWFSKLKKHHWYGFRRRNR